MDNEQSTGNMVALKFGHRLCPTYDPNVLNKFSTPYKRYHEIINVKKWFIYFSITCNIKS